MLNTKWYAHEHCSRCGGAIPAEGSEAWRHETSETGDCPGHLATLQGETVMVCGAFDPALDPGEPEPEEE